MRKRSFDDLRLTFRRHRGLAEVHAHKAVDAKASSNEHSPHARAGAHAEIPRGLRSISRG
jgi:hypothetical protein